MVSEAFGAHAVNLDGDTGAYMADVNGDDVLPFTTDAHVVRCLNCQRQMYAGEYIGADHGCVPSGQFVGDELDGDLNFDDDADHVADRAADFGAALGLAIVAAAAAATLAVIVTTVIAVVGRVTA